MELVIPDHVTALGASCFRGCTGLTELVIPNYVTTLGNYCFTDCTGLTKVTLPVDFSHYKYDSFYKRYYPKFDGCTNVESIHYTYGQTGEMADRGSSSHSYTLEYYSREKLKSVTFDEGITKIGTYAFYNGTALEDVTFRGNAPAIGSNSFYGVTANAYYPAGDDTWTEDVMQDYGGTLTWMSYIPEESGEPEVTEPTEETLPQMSEPAAVPAETIPQVTEPAPVPEVMNPVSKSEEIAEESIRDAVDEPSVNAVYPGQYETEVTDDYTLKTANFSGLVPGEQYVMLALVDIDAEDPLAADNLLAISQAAANEDGTLTFRYVQRTPTELSYVVACGASSKNLRDAVITIPEMVADGQLQVVEPVVVYDGETLVEGTDYTVSGTVSFTEAGTYTCYIRGVNRYTGLVECTYTVRDAVTYTSASISLAGDIGVNYYAQLSDAVIADEGAYMQFTVAGQTQIVPLSDAVVSADGTYRFTCKVAAKQMTEAITGQMYLSDGTAVGDPKVYSVKAYCDAAIPVYSQYAAYADLVELMEAMLNYGGYSQTQFGYNTENLANAGLDTTLPAITAADVDAYAHGATGSEEGISVASVSLLLESTTTIRFYFKLDGTKSIDEYTFYVDGVETIPIESNGQYYVDKVNVAAKDLDEMVTVTIGGLTVKYCGLSYVRQVAVLYPTYYSEALINVAKALYAYNQAANAYFA